MNILRNSFVAAAVLTLAGVAQAQAAKTDAASKLAGEWEGTFRSPHGPGGLWLKFTKDSIWTASVEMTIEGQTIPTRVLTVKVDSNTVTWTQELMGMTCTAHTVVDNDTMTGATACGHDGASLDVSLKRKP